MLLKGLVIAFLDELAIAMYIDMEVLIQLDNAFEYTGLFLYGLGRDIELIGGGHGIGLPVLLIILAERLYKLFVVENLRLEFRLVELVMGLEIVHGSIEEIDLFRPGHFKIIRHLLGHEILCNGQEPLCMKELILLDKDA